MPGPRQLLGMLTDTLALAALPMSFVPRGFFSPEASSAISASWHCHHADVHPLAGSFPPRRLPQLQQVGTAIMLTYIRWQGESCSMPPNFPTAATAVESVDSDSTRHLGGEPQLVWQPLNPGSQNSSMQPIYGPNSPPNGHPSNLPSDLLTPSS